MIVFNKYIVFDIETANRKGSSICQIGMVKVKQGKIIEEFNELVRPSPNVFDYRNIQIHGINETKVEKEKSFQEVWKNVEKFIDDSIMVAHFAQFDFNCLRKSFLENNMDHKNLYFCCSCRLAQETIVSDSHKLSYLSENITKFKYLAHDALEDCRATYKLMEYMINENKLEDIITNKYQIGKLENRIYKGFILK